MLSFSMMLYIQLGGQMEGFRDQSAAFVSIFRALFGDFDIDDIIDNSSGYLNTLLFLTYLFVAIFVMLSMFLALLAEGQIAFRDDQAEDEKFALSMVSCREACVCVRVYRRWKLAAQQVT